MSDTSYVIEVEGGTTVVVEEPSIEVIEVGAGVIALDNGKILIGGADTLAHQQSVSGDATITNAGVLTLSPEFNLMDVVTVAGVGTITGANLRDSRLVFVSNGGTADWAATLDTAANIIAAISNDFNKKGFIVRIANRDPSKSCTILAGTNVKLYTLGVEVPSIIIPHGLYLDLFIELVIGATNYVYCYGELVNALGIGGVDKSVLFNDGGIFGGTADFTYDKTTKVLDLQGVEVQLYSITGTDYERAFLKWDSNIFKIGTEAGGTGLKRSIQVLNTPIDLNGNGTTFDNSPLSISGTWNTETGGMFGVDISPIVIGNLSSQAVVGLYFSVLVSGGATNPGTLYGIDMNLSTSNLAFSSVFGILISSIEAANSASAYGLFVGHTKYATNSYNIYSAGVGSRNKLEGNLEFGNAATTIAALADTIRLYGKDYDAGDARLYIQSESGNPIIIGKNEIQFYNTVGNDYERAFSKWDTNVFKIGTEKGGSGTLRPLQVDTTMFSIDHAVRNKVVEDIDFSLDDVLNTGIAASFGLLVVRDDVDNTIGIFLIESQTVIILCANVLYSKFKDNPGTYNVYWETDQFKVQNKVANSKDTRVAFYGL